MAENCQTNSRSSDVYHWQGTPRQGAMLKVFYYILLCAVPTCPAKPECFHQVLVAHLCHQLQVQLHPTSCHFTKALELEVVVANLCFTPSHLGIAFVEETGLRRVQIGHVIDGGFEVQQIAGDELDLSLARFQDQPWQKGTKAYVTTIQAVTAMFEFMKQEQQQKQLSTCTNGVQAMLQELLGKPVGRDQLRSEFTESFKNCFGTAEEATSVFEELQGKKSKIPELEVAGRGRGRVTGTEEGQGDWHRSIRS